MRWERLFADLEGEAAELDLRDRDAEIAERTRAELGAVRWLERVRGGTGHPVTLLLAGPARMTGEVRYVGPDWVLLGAGQDDLLVPAHAVVGVEGAGRAAPADAERVPLTWRAAWRSLSRDRAAVRVQRRDGEVVTGVVDAVGADFVQLGPAGTLVPFDAIRLARAARTDG